MVETTGATSFENMNKNQLYPQLVDIFGQLRVFNGSGPGVQRLGWIKYKGREPSLLCVWRTNWSFPLGKWRGPQPFTSLQKAGPLSQDACWC